MSRDIPDNYRKRIDAQRGAEQFIISGQLPVDCLSNWKEIRAKVAQRRTVSGRDMARRVKDKV